MTQSALGAKPVGASSTVKRRLLADLAIAAILFAGSAVWATSFWNHWTANGKRGAFYQAYFEPAVMVACGKGFVISSSQPKPLEDFLSSRRDTFDCGEIPAGLPLGTQDLYQGAWRYLLVSIGLGWRILGGISWSGMGPIAGFGFGGVIALAYGIFRLGMGPALAVVGSILLAASPMHLLNLPHLRDYSKAPFTLALVLIVGLLVTGPVSWRRVLALSATYGAVLGIGYGFRTDFLVNLPVLLVVLFAFLEGGMTRNLRLKSSAAVLFLATFAAFSWPITSRVYASGGCQWHVTLLGLQSPFDAGLRIGSAPYDFGHAYADLYIYQTVNGYHWRTEPESPPLGYCSHEYDVQSGRYLQNILVGFPADIIARSYASILQIVELPMQRVEPPIDNWFSPLNPVRQWLEEPTHHTGWLIGPGRRWGLMFAALTVLLTAAANTRQATFLLFFLAYFGGYPAIQFQERHYFHLEFMGWWAIGFVLQRTLAAFRDRSVARPRESVLARGVVRAAVFAAVSVTVLAGVLLAARSYQTRLARQLLNAYIAAPKTVVEAPESPLAGLGHSEWPQLLEIQLNEMACGERPEVTFRYEKADINLDFTRTMTVRHRSVERARGPTRIFLPVFEKFAGLDLAKVPPGCLVGVHRVTDLRPFPLLLGATLPPGWEAQPLYQRLPDW